MQLKTLLTQPQLSLAQKLSLFGLLNLGVIESLANGLLSAGDALQLFYHGDNCRFVRKELRDKIADRIMSHGVQLPDLFDILPVKDAHRAFQQELATMRALCLKLLEKRRLVA